MGTHYLLARHPALTGGLRLLASLAGLGVALAWAIQSLGFRSAVFALVANWLIMAWAAVTSPPLRWRLPGRYFQLRRWECDGQVYRWCGVRVFGALVRRPPVRWLSPELYLHGRQSQLPGVWEGSRRAEAVHVWLFGLSLLLTLFAIGRGWWDAALWLFAFNVVLNLYPVLHQRYIRGRLDRVKRAFCRRNRPGAQSAAPNGGPATPVCNSGLSEGPPSMS